MGDLRFYVLFNSISDILERLEDDNERLYAMEDQQTSELPGSKRFDAFYLNLVYD